MQPSPLRVLLVEDDTVRAQSLETCLRNAGHEVVAVDARGDTTLTAARMLQPDVVVMNENLRGALDGVAVAQVLRAHTPLPVPVVFVTTSTQASPARARLLQAAPLAILSAALAEQLPGVLATINAC